MTCPTALIVDDEHTLRSAISDYLSTAGYRVASTGEVEEAQALLANAPFDFVVTDLRLSPIDHGGGLLLIAAVRERSAESRVVVITGTTEPEFEAEAMRLGVDLFLRKPVALAELVQAMDAMQQEISRV